MLDLYVMQNSVGCLKIGRSAAPITRKKSIASIDLCSLELVVVLEGQGHFEENVHHKLDEHRLTGEWFDGSDKSKKAVAEALNIRNIAWPFVQNDAIAGEWLKKLETKRDLAARIREHNRLLKMISKYNYGSRILDRMIFNEINTYEYMEITLDIDRNYRFSYINQPDIYGPILPYYSTKLTDALQIWPAQLRPNDWLGSVIECCIEGLKANRITWKDDIPIWQNKARFAGPKRFLELSARQRLLAAASQMSSTTEETVPG
jgi:hypothetical protein